MVQGFESLHFKVSSKKPKYVRFQMNSSYYHQSPKSKCHEKLRLINKENEVFVCNYLIENTTLWNR